MKLDYQHSKEEWKAAARAIRGTIAGATRAAFQDLAKQVQTAGRAEIARSGLGPRFARGFRTYVFPRRITPGSTAELAMRGQHRLGYANVFERGSRISGRPLLWIPLPSAPKKLNGKSPTAGAMIQAGVRLFKIERPGRPPLLAGYAMRATPGRPVSVAQLRTGQRNVRRRQARAAFGGRLGARPSAVMLFIGLPAVKIRDRLNISRVYDQARRDLPGLYVKHLGQVNR